MGSYINSVELVISLLNLALQHMSWACKKCMDKDVGKFSSCSSMSALREKEMYDSSVKTNWQDSIERVRQEIGDRFEKMELNGKKITYVCPEQEDDINFLQSLIKEECADFELHYSSK